jgi:hypothetical protein
MFEVKSQEESSEYDYLVCEIHKCSGQAEKIFISNSQYVEICVYHYDEMNML